MGVLTLTLISLGSANATRLYPEYSPAAVGALITVLGAVFFSLATRFRSQARKRAAEFRWDRAYWKWVFILMVPSLLQGQLQQAALKRVGVGTMMTLVALGALALSTWRLVFPERGPGRRRHVVWFVIGLVGVVLLARPFTDGAESWGLVMACLVSAIGVSGTIVSGKLTELGDLTRVVELMGWSAACLVGVPVLVWTDDHWMTWRVLSTVALTSALFLVANLAYVRAYELARSDGLISTVQCLNPVVACLVGLLVGTGVAPNLYGWIGAGLVVLASAVAARILLQGSDHTGLPVKNGVWTEDRFDTGGNSPAWIAGLDTVIRVPDIWKTDEWLLWKDPPRLTA
ncbi:DMT family transporter [Actinomadura sp. KC345]|uniref:DMT family transporter n=1 Tax=Actinomadura sp. KC345 TaxID=2530371 RepID=UPI001045540D|nr:DMT family transporter [Actinomadura sp. KC345]TDC44872.1 DMT family transporter [Actinomadura sp. KC345]